MPIAFPNFIDGNILESAERAPDINPSNCTTSSASSRAARRRTSDAAVAAARARVPGVVADHAAGALRHPRPRRHRNPRAQGGARPAALARERQAARRTASAKRARAGAIFKFFAGEALRIAGEKLDSVRPGIEVEITREPLGVVGVDHAVEFSARDSRMEDRAGARLRQLRRLQAGRARAGVAVGAGGHRSARRPSAGRAEPRDGPGLDARRRARVRRRDVDAISFTGSQDVGPHGRRAGGAATARACSSRWAARIRSIVLDDADLRDRGVVAVNGAYFQTGQRCTASSRIIVTEGIHDRFVDAMVERMKTLVVDDALKPGTRDRAGRRPASARQESRVPGDRAATKGRASSCGGERLKRDDRRLLHGAGDLHRHRRRRCASTSEEIFGPVAAVIRVQGLRRGAGGRERHAVRPLGGHRARRR